MLETLGWTRYVPFGSGYALKLGDGYLGHVSTHEEAASVSQELLSWLPREGREAVRTWRRYKPRSSLAAETVDQPAVRSRRIRLG